MDLIHGNPADSAKKMDDSRGSTGVTGFALTAMCIRCGPYKWILTREKAKKDLVRRTLRSYTNGKVFAQNGWFYHFNDVHTGARWKEVEISTERLYLAARRKALTCRQFFHEDHEIVELATLLYRRYDFLWMTNGDGKLLSCTVGSLKVTWLFVTTSIVPARLQCTLARNRCTVSSAASRNAWYAWERNPNIYASYNYIGTSLLWTYQYPFAWFGTFAAAAKSRHQESIGSQTARTATTSPSRVVLHRSLAKEFPGYTKDIWGITSSSSPKGYKAWGGPQKHVRRSRHGSVVPCAARRIADAYAFDICIPAMHAMKDKYGDKAWGKYGLADAFNPGTGWVSTDTLGLGRRHDAF